ncbi:MAG: hypothetical protein FVQ76_07990 [Nitrospira sp.]|jgi:hypothetical protein|nr:hypothetical protein [Nitrospira sp.]
MISSGLRHQVHSGLDFLCLSALTYKAPGTSRLSAFAHHKEFMMLKITPFLYAALAVLFSIVAYAQQTPLTKADVRNVIDTVKELQREVDKDKAYDFEKMTQVGATLKSQVMYNKYLNIIKSHGFSGPEIWTETVTRVFKAYGAYKMQQESPEMDAQMQQAISQVQNNSNLTAEQKQQMLQMMGQAKQSMRTYVNASSSDIKVVKPFVAEIDATFGKRK